MRRPLALLARGERRVAAEALLGTAAALALLARIHGLAGLGYMGLGLLLAASLLVVVQAPIGSVPLGYALVIALADLTRVEVFFPVLGLALIATAPVLANRYGHGDSARRVIRWLAASAGAVGAAALARAVVPGTSPLITLLHVSLAGTGFLSLELLLRNLLPTVTSPPTRFRDSWPVGVSLVCASGLFAVAYRQDGMWMALVALIPLVLTRFAFDRYAAAQLAYRQTIKALSIVPEVAGVTPLGHGERSAVYAVALARRLSLNDDVVDRIATAARLHHIGYVTVDDPQESVHTSDHRLLARLGGDILRQTKFLADVGDLVESVHADEGALTREAAVLQVATAFDHLVLEDPGRAQGAVELLAFRQTDPYGAAAVLALRWVLEEDPVVLERAIASGKPLTEAAGPSRALYV